MSFTRDTDQALVRGEAGIRRAVIGHRPQDRGPSVDPAGTLLQLDSNACGMRSPSGIQMLSIVTLARIPEGPFEQTEFVTAGMAVAPDRELP